jgi:hypothetical protein
MIAGNSEKGRKTLPCCGLVETQHVIDLPHVYQFDFDLERCGQCGTYWVWAWRMGIGGWEEITTEDAEKMQACNVEDLRAFIKMWASYLN